MNEPAPTVFIVDDDPVLRRALALLMECEGFQAEAFASAGAFLDAWGPERPGCLILDIDLPGLDGLALQEQLAQSALAPPIIFLTGQADVPQTVRAFRAGCADLLEKPASDEVLLARVRQAVADDASRRVTEARRGEMTARLKRLTAREHEVLRRVISGLSSKEVARELDISHRTVEVHRRRVLEKMEAGSLAELIEFARDCGIEPERRVDSADAD